LKAITSLLEIMLGIPNKAMRALKTGPEGLYNALKGLI